jgi:hypothetical protein
LRFDVFVIPNRIYAQLPEIENDNTESVGFIERERVGDSERERE